MPKPDYSKPLEQVAAIEAACADVRRDLAQAASVEPARSQAPAGQQEEDQAADKTRVALEEAARGHLGDIAQHAADAGAASWVAAEPPAAPVVTSSEPAPGSVSSTAPNA